MAEQTNQQQRLITALGYVFTPVVPLVVLASDLKHDLFMKRHAGQALLWSAGFIVALALAVIAAIWMLRADLLFLCLLPVLFLLPFLPGMVWGWSAYQGGDPRPPLIAPLAARLFPTD
ncbi:MAG: hypothetical protein WEC79_03840 [Thermomicrobiales bacterium]